MFALIAVIGNHDWGQDKSTGARRCPMCLEQGAVVTLCMGCEPAFYVDFGPPTYAFNPCGHMATEKTVKYECNRSEAISDGISIRILTT